MTPERIKLMQGDCLEKMKEISDGLADMVFADPPYGVTRNKWDSVIPLELMWEQLKRIIKSDGAIIFLASQPFTTVLIASNMKMFKYCWVWNKINKWSGFLNAKKQPIRVAEDIVVFYNRQPTYNPQMIDGEPYVSVSSGRKSSNYGRQIDKVRTINKGEYYPRNLLSIEGDERGTVGRIYPTQKPIALMEYLIRTYTNKDEIVLDFCMGSGTTGVACTNTGRNFIGIELDSHCFEMAEKRINKNLIVVLEIMAESYEKRNSS